jgi:hypothetical protein
MASKPKQFNGIGVRAWVDPIDNGPKSEIYVPVRIGQGKIPKDSGTITAGFVPLFDLRNLNWSVAYFNPQTRADTTILPLVVQKGSHVRGSIATVTISRDILHKPGIYHLFVTGNALGEDTVASADVWFFQ